MTDKIDHFEALFDSNYLRWFDLQCREFTLEIKSVKQEELTVRGGAKKKAPVVTFTVGKKPLVLNKTNARTIADLCKSHRVSDWIGKRITLYTDSTQLFNQETRKMETVQCIRVKGAS